MYARRGIEARVSYSQTFYWLAANDMRVENFVHIGGRDVSIPNCFGIDHDIGTMLALVEAAGVVGANSSLQTAP